METLKIDKTKLKTVTNFAKDEGVTRQAIYIRAKKGELKLIEIDGVKFVKIS